MKKFFWFVVGTAAGLAAAKQIKENPKAAALVEEYTQKAREFGAYVTEGFNERSAELNTQRAKDSGTTSASQPTEI
ncbi:MULTISPECIES: hypothetical protein [Rhodoluna]|jgi:hypothetical protein|uniref:hypothetical protein n=1 Tax=Rhodoluna TaxID=529883 RepID=UPI0011070A62|nr:MULTISPECIES: hypothetical protein [Rhodoluna]BDS49052.1 hypothetical protein RKAS3_06290 [Rhodoluna sp. KAS3]